MISSNETAPIIQQEAKALFSLLDAAGEISVTPLEEGVYRVELQAQEAQTYIGENGKVLFAIQQLLRGMVRKKLGENVKIVLDINGYRKNKELYLRELARTTADEVSLLRVERELSPMPSPDRRVIHTELTNRTDVVSESVGEEPNRRIVIKPKPS